MPIVANTVPMLTTKGATTRRVNTMIITMTSTMIKVKMDSKVTVEEADGGVTTPKMTRRRLVILP